MRIVITLISSLLLAGCSMFGYNADVKEPRYQTLVKDSDYEVREYSSIVTVTAFAKGDFSQAQDQTFKKLFDYISGNNVSKKNIPMTAPVLMQGTGEKISMTAPVLMQDDVEGWAMSFVLPDTYTLQTAPKPLNETLELAERKNTKYAVLHFSGLFSDSVFQEKSKILERWMSENNLKASGPALRAGYNPPWTLPPLRRNEVLIPVE